MSFDVSAPMILTITIPRICNRKSVTFNFTMLSRKICLLPLVAQKSYASAPVSVDKRQGFYIRAVQKWIFYWITVGFYVLG